MKVRMFFLIGLATLTLVSAQAFALEIREPGTGSTNINISQPLNDNLLALGDRVSIDAAVNGDLFAVGQTIEINAPITGNLFAAGGSIELNAPVSGDMFAGSNKISFGEKGNVARGLYYVSNNKPEDFKGKVAGKIVTPEQKPVTAGQRARGVIFAGLALLFTGIVLIRLFPKATAQMADNLVPNWGKNFLAGIITLIVAPIVAAFLIASSIGVPVGLVLLALWLWELYVGLVVATYTIGRLVLKNHPNELVRFALGALIITVIGFMPGIAGTVKFILILFGLGSIVLAKYDLYQKLRSQL